MPRTDPLPIWKDEDVFVIGGGPSLKDFHWEHLRDLPTIGCNHAFSLGAGICKICTFGDLHFWDIARKPLEDFGGWVVTNYRIGVPPPWLVYFDRLNHGLAGPKSGQLAWNGNTGCLAVQLALRLGAKRVFLLGFDMNNITPTQAHWHNLADRPQRDEQYAKFCRGFEDVARSLPKVYPGAKVYNVTDGSSRLLVFPTIHPQELFVTKAEVLI